MTQESQTLFSEQMARIRRVTGTRTQLELAEFLGVSQSAVSDAVRRGRVPAEWLVTLVRARNVSPEWVLTGGGPCRMTLPGQYEVPEEAGERREAEAALRRASSRALTEELLRRIAASGAGAS